LKKLFGRIRSEIRREYPQSREPLNKEHRADASENRTRKRSIKAKMKMMDRRELVKTLRESGYGIPDDVFDALQQKRDENRQSALTGKNMAIKKKWLDWDKRNKNIGCEEQRSVSAPLAGLAAAVDVAPV
jgi:hypothetical protein